MNKIKIEDGKINWICLGDKCPRNCCGPFKTDESREALWKVKEDLLPLTQNDYKLMVKNLPPVDL